MCRDFIVMQETEHECKKELVLKKKKKKSITNKEYKAKGS